MAGRRHVKREPASQLASVLRRGPESVRFSRRLRYGCYMVEDAELLRRFTESGSEPAFAELVHRRIGLVYAVALRTTRDAQRAEDAVQVVFASLARNASALSRHPVLLGWLHRAAHNAAMDIVRAEASRAVREREAHSMQEILASPSADPDWEKVRPILDATISELPANDRDVVLLRFFEDRRYAEIGRALGLTENTARMRVERALEKLQTLLTRRGIVSTTAALSTALACQDTALAPHMLAGSVLRQALTAARSASVLHSFLTMILTPKFLFPAVTVLAVMGLMLSRPFAQSDQTESTRSPIAKLPIEAAPPSAGASIPAAKEGPPPPAIRNSQESGTGKSASADPRVVAQRRAIMNHLRQISAARDAFLKFQNRLPASLDDIVGPTKMIRELKPVANEDYRTVRLDSRILSVDLPGDGPVTLTTDGPARRGPPTLAESAEWKAAFSSYLQTRPPGAAPQLPTASAPTETPAGWQFAGQMASATGPVFIVTDQTGTTHWVRQGHRLGAHTVAEYHEQEETLVLTHDTSRMSLKLRQAKPIAAPFATETEIAYLALRETQAREGWATKDIVVNKPDLGRGVWFVHLYRIIETNERRIEVGEQVHVMFNPDGTVSHYKNAGVRPAKK